MSFLDSNILVYATLGTGEKAVIARDVLRTPHTISVQVLNEFTSVARRKFKRSWDQIDVAMQLFRTLFPHPRPLTLPLHEHARRLAERYGFAFYDALIVAAAIDARCDTLLSEDMQHGMQVERLIIRNPFHA